MRHALVHQHHGRALKLLAKVGDDKSTKEIDNNSIEVSTWSRNFPVVSILVVALVYTVT